MVRTLQQSLGLLLLAANFMFGQAQAAVQVSGRHIFILYPGVAPAFL